MADPGQGFPDPVTALNAIVTCLAMPSNVVVHTGSLDSGLTIPCCIQPCNSGDCGGGVLRVETGMTTPKLGVPTAMIITGKCAQPLTQEIVINYRECFPSNLGKTATPVDQLTAAGLSIVISWWEAINRIWNCSTKHQQRFRFVNRMDSPPEGNCAGWTLTLECDIVACNNPTPQTLSIPPVDLGAGGNFP
jgi:hypothetical protein